MSNQIRFTQPNKFFDFNFVVYLHFSLTIMFSFLLYLSLKTMKSMVTEIELLLDVEKKISNLLYLYRYLCSWFSPFYHTHPWILCLWKKNIYKFMYTYIFICIWNVWLTFCCCCYCFMKLTAIKVNISFDT